jgi:putative RNA 2'-phosphotransferase
VKRNASRSVELSKVLSSALRHAPDAYHLALGDEGWVDLSDLVDSLRRDGWSDLTTDDVENLVRSSSKKRHEIADGRIRALYGHSVPTQVFYPRGNPPKTLYHGTSPSAAALIRQQGLKPMRRQYVHLSTDVSTAQAVGRRKASDPVVLSVAASEASLAGVQFYAGNDQTWLAEAVPPDFIDFSSAPADQPSL